MGGPWKVTGYLFTENFPAGSPARASVINDVQSGQLQVVPHSFSNIAYGNMYWHAAVSEHPRALTDGEWTDNLAAILAWKQGNGGSDVIPSFSRPLSHVMIRKVARYEEDLLAVIFESISEFHLPVKDKTVLLKPNLVGHDPQGVPS